VSGSGSELDVVVVGEVLVELASDEPLSYGASLALGVSGDAVNAAAAAAAAGARTAVLTRIADDELGDLIEARLVALGVDTSLVHRVEGQQGAYLVHADPTGHREFVYLRRGSAGAGLTPDDVLAAGVERAGVVLGTGVTAAISESARAALLEAARRARRFVYDPNHRPRLTTSAAAADVLREVAPYTSVVTPACPGETEALLGTDEPLAAARAALDLGATSAVVTCGERGTVVVEGPRAWRVPAVPAPALVDQTGAGDSLAGTVAGRLALGDDLLAAVRLGSAAASLALGGRGGTGRVATLEESRAHLAAHGADPVAVEREVVQR
jgi:2-dehydro-3-deoxygluconokinase